MINKLLIATEQDKKEFMERERRKQAERDRQNRIFDNRYRKIGVDVKALDFQIIEQNCIKENEKKLEEAMINQINRDNELAAILAANERKEKRRFEDQLNKYRLTCQRREDTREYDLNDPELLKKQEVLSFARLEEIGLPCGQVFAGEDNRKKEREKVMAEQKSAWLEQQIQERNALNAEQKAADFIYKQREKARDERALKLELIERKCRRQIESSVLKFNKHLADQKSCQNVEEVQNEAQDNNAEIYNHLTSDLMVENGDAAKSAFGPHRIIPYMYKGMTPEERKAIRIAQMNQIMENQLKKDIEKKNESDWQNWSEKLSMTKASADAEERNKRRLEAINVKMENLLLSQKQKERRQYFDKIVYTNDPTEDFFNKFNTTSR